MGKNFKKLMFTLMIVLLAFPILGSNVFAEVKGYDIEDGEYSITVEALKVNEDVPSGAAGYIGKDARLIAKDGQITIELTVPYTEPIRDIMLAEVTGLQIEGKEFVSETEDENALYKTYKLDNLTEYITSQVQYLITNITTGKEIHDGDEPFRLHITNFEELPVTAKETIDSGNTGEDEKADNEENEQETGNNSGGDIETPTENENTKPNTDPKQEQQQNEDKTYEINYVVKHATANETSSADSFFTKPALLITKDGVNYLQLTITGWDMIDYLRTADGDVKVLKVNADGSALVQFKVNGNLASPINLDMHITVPGMYSMQHSARLFLDLDSKKEVKDNTTAPVNNKDKATNNNNNNATKADNKKATNNKAANKQEVESNQLKPDKAYTMNYIVKHATQDQESAANQFFKKPAVLLTKNGVNYLQLTITNWSMVDSLSTAYGEVAVVKVNSDGSAVVQLRVNGDLADPIKLDMHITVPGMYSMQHSARLFLDVDSKTEISTGNHEIAAASNGNGVVVNPQTGENTNILLYVLLLIGSSVPLAMVVKRRFA